MSFKMYLVGGAVRDELLGKPSKDLDLLAVGEGSFEDLLFHLDREGYRLFQVNQQFLNVRANHPVLGPVDVALPRSEGSYTDGRRPDSVNRANLLDDLSRRDFTVNAMAKDLESGVIHDPFGGRKHLEKRVLVAVGNANKRFEEDGLRALRALRFSVCKGFDLSLGLLGALLDFVPEVGLRNVSRERMRDELAKMFASDTLKALDLLNRLPKIRDYVLGRGGVNLQPTLGAVKH